jgi:hypothetical protein
MIMKRSLLIIIFSGLLLSGFRWFLGALEVEVVMGAGNMAFNASKEEPVFSELELLGYLNLKDDFLGKTEYSLRYERDNFYQNTLSAQLSIDLDYFYLEFGPFVGFWDSMRLSFKKGGAISYPKMPPDVGITGGLRLAFPGIVFLSLIGSSTLNLNYDFLGGNSREMAEINLGFWLPYVIPTISASAKSFTRHDKDLRDDLARFQASADIIKKNIPITLRFDFGYEILNRCLLSSEDKAKMQALFTGFEIRWQLLKTLRLIGGAEIPIPLKQENLENAGLRSSLLNNHRIYTGAAFTF